MGSRADLPPTLWLGRYPALESALTGWVRAVQAGDPLRPVTVVVGSRAARDRVSWVVAAGLGAVANVRVTTLPRLALELRPPGDEALPRPLTRLARQRLVARLVAERAAASGWYFAPVASAPGLAAAFLRTFDDLREACVEPGDLPARAGKEADVAALYGRYVAELEARDLLDDAALYASAAAVAAACDGPVALYGFYDLPEMQARLVASLATGGGLSAFVPVVPGAEAYAQPVLRLLESCGLDLAPLADGEAGRRALDRARRLMYRPREPLEASPVDESLAVVSAPDEAGQVGSAVAEVLAAAGRGVRFHEMAVVTPDPATRRRVATALMGQGIPVAAMLPYDPPVSRACRLALDAVVPEAGPALAREAVIAFAAVARRPALAARWDDLSRRRRVIGGHGQWRERLGGRGGPSGGEPSESDPAVSSLLRLVDALEAARVALGAAASWPGLASTFADGLERLADGAGSEAAVGELHVEPVAGVLRDLSDLGVVEDECDAATFAAALRHELSTLESPAVPGARVGRRGVAVTSPEQMRGAVFRLVVVCDLAEAGFPARGVPDPLLDDDARRLLASRSGVSLRPTADRDREGELLFALALDAAVERAALIAPRIAAASGRPRLPSRVLLEACGALAGRAVMFRELEAPAGLAGLVRRVPAGVSGLDGDGDDALDLRDLDVRALVSRAAGRDAVVEAVFGDAAERRRGGALAARSGSLTAWDALISPAHGAEIRDLLCATPVSPTALQTYLDCPFVFYVRYALGLRVPDEAADELSIAPSDLGTIAHRLLRLAFEGGGGREAVLDRLAAAAPGEFAAAERKGVTGHPLVWRAVAARLLDDLSQAVHGDECWSSGGTPWLFEWSFGDDPGREVRFEAGGARLRFEGKVDRLDRLPDGTLRLVDYKTGRGGVEAERVRRGDEVQLAVYLEAVRALLAPDAGLSAAYRLVTRKGGFASVAVDDDGGERLGRVLGAVLEAVAAGEFAATAIGGRRCVFCELQGLCGAERLAMERKTGEEGGTATPEPQAPA